VAAVGWGAGSFQEAEVGKAVLAAAVVAVLSDGAVWARGPEITPVEYERYMDWKEGRLDPRLEKLSEDQKLAKIAASMGIKPAELKKAVDKVTPVAPSIAADSERAIQASAQETPLKGRVLEVHVDADQGHVVAGFKWRCGDERDADKEAAYAAWAVNEGAPVAKTLVLWCVNEIDTKLFSAKIGRTAFEKVQKDQVDRFATTRYIKLFEEVKRGPHT
jgi:hypothetical protein